MKRQCIVLSISENKILNNNHFIINFDLCAFAQFPFYATCKQTVNLGNSWNASNRLTLLRRAAPEEVADLDIITIEKVGSGPF